MIPSEIRETMQVLPVVERFVSINGEGVNAGKMAAFIRLLGCNLGCSYCDTSWANVPDCPVEWLDVDQLCAWVRETGAAFVTLTGGEPLLHPQTPALIAALATGENGVRDDLTVEIETNGSIALGHAITAGSSAGGRVQITMDYKLPSSGMTASMREDNLSLLRAWDTVKFVAGTEEDLACALRVISENDLQRRCNVYLSPVFSVMDPQRLVEFVKDNGLDRVTVQLQLHKVIWPADMKGV